MIFNNWL